MKNRNAFTLPELLVVLIILGVIAALTMPLLNQATPDPNKILAKKVYTNTAEIVDDMINNASLYPEYGDDGTPYVGFDNTVAANGCSGNTKFGCLFRTYLNGSNVSAAPDSPFITSDGVTWTFGTTSAGESGSTTITIDVATNEAAKKDKHTFKMTVANDGKITVVDGWAQDAIKFGHTNHFKD